MKPATPGRRLDVVKTGHFLPAHPWNRTSFHPKTADGTIAVSSPKEDIFRHGKKIKGLRGGVLGYAAQGIPKIDTARAEKGPFWTET